MMGIVTSKKLKYCQAADHTSAPQLSSSTSSSNFSNLAFFKHNKLSTNDHIWSLSI